MPGFAALIARMETWNLRATAEIDSPGLSLWIWEAEAWLPADAARSAEVVAEMHSGIQRSPLPFIAVGPSFSRLDGLGPPVCKRAVGVFAPFRFRFYWRIG